MNKWLMGAAFLAAIGVTSAQSAEVTVNDVGSVLNESLSLPAQDTPGSSISFQEFFEFSLPVSETVTLSMTDSAILNQKITGGVISLNDWTSTGVVSPFIPMGALIESAPIVNFVGGQGATVTPDVLAAGNYFAKVVGTSGTSPIHIAVDGTVTGVSGVGSPPIPEPSTWAMLIIGAAFMAWAGVSRSKQSRFVV